MSSQQHNYPLSLVPGRKAVAHRVDYHQDLQQVPRVEPSTYVAYHAEHASSLERARKDGNRNHRIVDAHIHGPSYADGGMDVSHFLRSGPSASASGDTPGLALASASARSQAVRQPAHRARPEASPQPPSQALPRASAQPTSRSNTHPPYFKIPRKPFPASHDPSHTASPSTLNLTPTPSPSTSPAIVHISELNCPLPDTHFVGVQGVPCRKDISNRDSINSNAFIEAGLLDDDVPVHLIKHIENPRTTLERFKQKGRGFWHMFM